ncbi:restriction endonuclease [Streptomyces zhihengii]|uniref:restriction endonuclease n=1 Tax=Streptomyces zhihengii TaxID=1818004 RepID=UPI003626A9AD
MVQCKHRHNGRVGSAVGTPDLQDLNGTARQVHGADVAVIVTSGASPSPAAAFAQQQCLHVVDRCTLAVWQSVHARCGNSRTRFSCPAGQAHASRWEGRIVGDVRREGTAGPAHRVRRHDRVLHPRSHGMRGPACRPLGRPGKAAALRELLDLPARSCSSRFRRTA